ncbi:MAG: hypothetical protein ACRDOK_11080, partial [Streptosporangiaceae bacterium]
MKLTPIAAAALIASTLAGTAVTIMPFVNGGPAATLTAHATARPAVHAVSHLRPPAHHGARRATATAAAKPAASTTQPARQPP